jgi:hypothetical protein
MLLKNVLFLCIVLIAVTTFIPCSHARRTTVTGGLSIGYDNDRTEYDRDFVDNDEQVVARETDQVEQFGIAPLFIFETTSMVDGLTIQLNPTFVYDLVSTQQDIDSNFQISAFRDISRYWRVAAGNGFIYSNDPELLERENSSDYNRGRRRYWTNNFNLETTYSYAPESSVTVGYRYTVLRNDDTGIGGYEDYDRHFADIGLQHQFNSNWNIAVSTGFTRGLFDPPDQEVVTAIGDSLEQISPGITDTLAAADLSNDLTEYRFNTLLNWIYSTRKTVYFNYDFTGSYYDDILRNDSNLHELTAGFHYQFSRLLAFELAGGPSFETTETLDSRWGYNGLFGLDYEIGRNTSLSANVEKGYDEQNFSANNNRLGRDQGLTSFWQIEVSCTHQFTGTVQGSLFASYRDEKQENILYGIGSSLEADIDLEGINGEDLREESIFNRKIYEAGGSVNYTFWTWFTAAVRYSYRKHDSELINDSYDEQRIYLTLSVRKELFRW